MEKMVDVYRQNPSLGDPNTIEQQLAENAKELDALSDDLYKYQVRYRTMKILFYLLFEQWLHKRKYGRKGFA